MTDSDGRVYPLSDTSQLDASIKRKERKVAKDPGKNVKQKASLNREILIQLGMAGTPAVLQGG